MPRILLFIPAFNCERQVVRVLDQLDERARPWISRVLVVDNRSTDGTEAAVQAWMARRPEVPLVLLRNDANYSLGGSHKVAFSYATEHGFSHVAVLHGDDQADLADLVPWLEDGRALARDSFLGSRFHRSSRCVNYSWFRILGNHVFNALVSLVARRHLTDLGSGLNLYRTGYLAPGFYQGFPDNLNFNVYMLLYGVHCRSDFSFFPITWREEDQVSNVRFLHQSLEILGVCWRYLLAREELFRPSPQALRRDYTYQVAARSPGMDQGH